MSVGQPLRTQVVTSTLDGAQCGCYNPLFFYDMYTVFRVGLLVAFVTVTARSAAAQPGGLAQPGFSECFV